ncbi:RNA polymerase sigma-70 factor [Halalkalibaculum sp. DA3122]|uniref:RNA polymerase sigma-70 factor n=1 Tax=unclassified Halalkalibaculum TaxID=2964617 RepID=UPI003753F99C
MSDKLLFEKVKDGDEEAFEELFDKYYEPLVRFVWGYVKSEAIAEEIVQELFLKVWRISTTLTIQTSIKSYLYRAGRNMSLNHLKHRDTEQEWEEEKKALHKNQPRESKLDRNLHYKMLLKEVEQAIQDLPERRRLIFVLSRHQDMTYKEIADFLDISENTVDTQIRRALATLRERFSELLVSLIVFSSLMV